MIDKNFQRVVAIVGDALQLRAPPSVWTMFAERLCDQDPTLSSRVASLTAENNVHGARDAVVAAMKSLPAHKEFV